jgi:hypothetical protein
MTTLSAFAGMVATLNLGMWIASGSTVAATATFTNATVAGFALWMSRRQAAWDR